MDPKYKNRILRNLDYLTNSTSNIITVCVTLVAKECLTINEFQIVRGQLSDEQKCTELFTRLILKPNAFEFLIEALEETGNEHVARKLKQPTTEELKLSSTVVERDEEINLKSKVTNEQLYWIEDILCSVDHMYWNSFMRRLLKYDAKITNDVEKASKTEPHSEIVHKTLSAWINVNGDAATMENLTKTLKESQLNYAADSVMKHLSRKIADMEI